ncbi:hypothetical protein DFJ73DRAFT_140349 [Zopfochytrium polystomum]|nr:hypothetical protein DFJ73DRAFT_140349 [Zopfochytrium polystomum]
MFWEELETPFHQQIDLELNLRRLEEFGALADRLRTDWKLQKEEKLAKLVARLNELWKLCHLSEVEKESLSQQLATNLYSPLTLDAISSEIAVLEDRYKKEAPLYKAIHDRKCYIQKLIDFEKNASDPRRLFLPSFRLLEEEKFRRNGIPTLLAIESKLRSSVTKFEADHSRPFTYNGKRWLDVMDQEISERFLSDSFLTFEVQPGHQRSSSSGGGTSKQSSPKIISPVLQTPRRSSNRSQSPVVTPKSIPNSASKTPVTPGKRSASRPKTAPSRAEAQSQKPTRPIVGTKAPPPAGKVTAAMAAAVGGRGRGLGRGEGGGGASEVDVVARAADI